MKRKLSLLLAFVMLLSALSVTSVPAYADDAAASANELVFGQEKEYVFTYGENEASPRCWFTFTPEKSGAYQFNFTNNYKNKVYAFYSSLYRSLKDAQNSENYIEAEGDSYFDGKEYSDINPHFYVYNLEKGVTYYLDVYTLVNEKKNVKKINVPVVVIEHSHAFEDFYRAPVEDEPGDLPEGEYGKVCTLCGYEKNVHIFKAPKKPTLKVKAGKGSFTAIRKKNKSIKGFQLQYSKAKSFKSKKTKTYKKADKLKATVKKLKRGKKYYVRIRTYKVVKGHRVYSEWSKIKSVIIK